MNSNDKFRRKLRKLLALAASDNPHEAERAREQAKKMMLQHGISEDDAHIVDLAGKTLSYKRPRASDNTLLGLIHKISGVEIYFQATRTRDGRWHSTPRFLGSQSNAELACYAFDVLHRQMDQAVKKMRSELGVQLNAHHVENFRRGWIHSAATKLVNVFGTRDVPTNVSEYFNRHFGKIDSAKPRAPKTTASGDALIQLGLRRGESAELMAATGDDSAGRIRIGHSAP